MFGLFSWTVAIDWKRLAFLRSVSELPLGPGASHWILRRHCVCIQDLTFQSTKNCHLEISGVWVGSKMAQKWRADWLSWVFLPNGSSQGQADQSFWTRPAQASSRSIHVLHHILNIFEFFGNKPSRQLRSLAAALDRAEAGYYRLHNRRWTSWSQRLTFDTFANLCLLFGLLDVFSIFLYLMPVQRSFLCYVRSDSHSTVSCPSAG